MGGNVKASWRSEVVSAGSLMFSDFSGGNGPKVLMTFGPGNHHAQCRGLDGYFSRAHDFCRANVQAYPWRVMIETQR